METEMEMEMETMATVRMDTVMISFYSEEGLKEFVAFLDATRETLIEDSVHIETEKNGCAGGDCPSV